MRNLIIITFAVVVPIAGTMVSTPAEAATAGAVMKACDNVAAAGGSCNYQVNDHGDVYGCAQAKGSNTKTCFVCAGGGGCVGSTESGQPGKGVTIGGIRLPPGARSAKGPAGPSTGSQPGLLGSGGELATQGPGAIGSPASRAIHR